MKEEQYIDEMAEEYRSKETPDISLSNSVKPIAKFSEVDKDGKLDIKDVYVDVRAFLDRTNFSKFIIVSFTLILSPFLLYLGLLDAHTYREIVLIMGLTYLGVDAYQNRHRR